MRPKVDESLVLAKWLDAKFFKTDFRPVELIEYINIGKTVLTKDGTFMRTLDCKADDEAGRLGKYFTSQNEFIMRFLPCYQLRWWRKLRRTACPLLSSAHHNIDAKCSRRR